MADKSSFTPEEWKVVVSSPMLAGLAVTLAEPRGLWGMLKESMAGARAMLTAACPSTVATKRPTKTNPIT